jgi:glycosyltransferase involved in cell wall biosynthesis
MKKIVMVLQHDVIKPHLDGRVYKEAKSLVNKGYQVTIICWAFRLNQKSFQERINQEGIYIVRIFHNKFPKIHAPPLLKIKPFLEILKKTKKEIIRINPDIVHSHDILPLWVCYKSTKKIKAKLIYDAHELHRYSNEPKFLRLFFSIIEPYLIKKCDYIFCANEIRKKIMIDMYPSIRNKITTIENVPELINVEKSLIKKDNLIKFVYQGGMMRYRGIENILYALKDIKGNFQFYFYGGNKDQVSFYQKLAHKLNITDKVFLKGIVPVDVLYKELKKKDVGVVIVKNSSKNNYYCAPNKLYEYMMSNLAIIGPYFPHIKKTIEQNKIGITVDFDDVNSIKKGIEYIIEHKKEIPLMKQKGLKLYKTKYNWSHQEEKLVKIYEEI